MSDARTLVPEENFITDEPFYQPVGDEIAVFEAAYRNDLPVLLKGIDPAQAVVDLPTAALAGEAVASQPKRAQDGQAAPVQTHGADLDAAAALDGVVALVLDRARGLEVDHHDVGAVTHPALSRSRAAAPGARG